MGQSTEMLACKCLRTKHFHEVSSASPHAYSLKSRCGKVRFFPFGFLLRLKCFYPLWFIPLKSGAFIETDVCGICGIFFINNLFIMTPTFIGLAQIIDFVCMDATK